MASQRLARPDQQTTYAIVRADGSIADYGANKSSASRRLRIISRAFDTTGWTLRPVEPKPTSK